MFSLIAPDGGARAAGQVLPGFGLLGKGVILRGRAHGHRFAGAASLWAIAEIAKIIGHIHVRKAVAPVVNGRPPESI